MTGLIQQHYRHFDITGRAPTVFDRNRPNSPGRGTRTEVLAAPRTVVYSILKDFWALLMLFRAFFWHSTIQMYGLAICFQAFQIYSSLIIIIGTVIFDNCLQMGCKMLISKIENGDRTGTG